MSSVALSYVDARGTVDTARGRTSAVLRPPLAWAARTDRGRVRRHNEDCFTVDPGRGLFVVCDGMGGHAQGDVASLTACTKIGALITARDEARRTRGARWLLVEAIRAANRAVYNLGSGSLRPGTTVAAILWARGRIVVAHVGDSRVFRLRQGELLQLTRDHSYANLLVDEGRLTPEQAAHFARRNIITRGLGLRQDVDIDVLVSPVLPGDVFLLATDGLEVLGSETVRTCLGLPAEDAVAELIARSLAGGAPDNVTAVVVNVGDAA